ncbi:hypothetical protein DFQ30_009575 [Apophysomyces sp. BC1015]|nr:hypothetical protein DFQ30_009575 [Apophysomyces sp. BC1015]
MSTTQAETEPAVEDRNTVRASNGMSNMIAPTSPPYPPYGGYIDPAQLAYEHHHAAQVHAQAAAAAVAAVAAGGGGNNGGFDPNDPANYAYLYPLSPQLVQYYSDYSYPGSPAIHPQSPPVNPTSPPFSPTFQYQQGVTLSPPTHAYMLPPHSAQHYPPIHISPILTGTTSVPGSPPHQFVSLPGPFNLDTRPHKHKNQLSQQQQQDLQYHSHNIYVRGLSSSITDESFLDLCEAYGKVTSSKAIIDQKSGECKGYGFAMYENEDDCHNAIEGLNKGGFQASFARVGQESFSSRLRHLQDETSTNIYISNLPLDTTEQKLEDLFKPYQTVSNRILRDPQSGLSRGVGFARMSDRASAIAIIEKFNGHTIVGSSAPLQVRFADSPAQKKLKSQTTRKRMFRPREFQPMAGFPMRQMPITPETMLGIAPASMPNAGGFYQDPHGGYPRSLATVNPVNRHAADSLASPPDDDDVKELVAEVEKKLNVMGENEVVTEE